MGEVEEATRKCQNWKKSGNKNKSQLNFPFWKDKWWIEKVFAFLFYFLNWISTSYALDPWICISIWSVCINYNNCNWKCILKWNEMSHIVGLYLTQLNLFTTRTHTYRFTLTVELKERDNNNNNKIQQQQMKMWSNLNFNLMICKPRIHFTCDVTNVKHISIDTGET